MNQNHNITTNRLKEIDGLRGVAILLVLSFHYLNNQLVDNADFTSKLLAKLTGFGWVGVDLFFVLSGFLIGSILIYNKGAKNYFKTFYLRRIVRIIPNYFLLLFVFGFIFNLPFFKGNYFLSSRGEIPYWSYFAMVHNFYMAYFNNFGNRALSITWSIGIEEQFYILFPFLTFYLKDRYLPFILGAFVISSIIIRASYSTWMPQYVLLPSRMDGLSIGFLVAYCHQNGILERKKTIVLKASQWVIFGSILFSAFLYFRFNDLGPIKHTLFSMFFSGVLVFTLLRKDSRFSNFLQTKTLTWIGTISYSLYLFHYVILGLVYHINGKQGIGITNINDIALTVIALTLSLGFSFLVYRFLEKPMVNLGKKVQYQ